jgi:fumarate reductase subunit C/uncharacterized membrane protein YeaQ/YmgE (transglycosylase-associated protein family)
MSHYLSGILKIIVIEAFMALLVIDRLTGEKWERQKHLAFTTLVSLMVFGWTNWGLGRAGTSVWWVVAAIGVVWLCGWLVRAAVGRETSDRARRFASTMTSIGQPLKLPPLVMASIVSVGIGLGFCWLGVRNDAISWVHQHEQFHFYLGAKYQKEVGWFDLYSAAIMADRETVNTMAGITKTRDNRTFEEIPVEQALVQAPRIRAKFSDERWEAFKTDWTTMARTWPGMPWATVMNDHGNSNSPAWSIIAGPIANLTPLSKENQSLLGCIDLLLMLALFIAIYETFGFRLASVALFMWACVPVVFDYLSGSFLRWDWLFSLGLAVCFLKRQKWGTAGAFFGYAVATKLFPLMFGLALLVQVGFEWLKTRKVKKEWVAFGRNAVIAAIACVAIAAAMFGTSAWSEYAERIQVAQLEKFYSNQHSLKTVFLQVIGPGEGGLSSGIFPPVIKQSLPDVDIKDFAGGFLFARLAFTLVVVVLLRRASPVEAFTLGPLLVFAWLTVNMYYWNMMGLLALGLASRREKHFFLMLLGFFGAFITYYTYQHLNRGFAEGYLISLIIAVLAVVVAALEWRETRRSPTT